MLCAIVAFGASAQKERGFRSFVDFGYTYSLTDIYVDNGRHSSTDKASDRVMVTYTGGYQFSPDFFIGVGAGASYWYSGSAAEATVEKIGVPIFANVRYDLRTSGKFSYFVDARAGYSVVDISGLYIAPYVGARLALGDTFGLNLGVGYEYQKLKDVDGTLSGVAVKLGFDF